MIEKVGGNLLTTIQMDPPSSRSRGTTAWQAGKTC
jgi:hypothetical protein